MILLDGSEMSGSGWKFTGKNIKMDFFPLIEAENMLPKDNMALISLNDPNFENNIQYDLWKNHIIFKFHDIDTGERDGSIIFKREMARKLIEFILALPSDVDNIVVHCFAGICRSGGVVRFLQKHMYPSCFNETFWMKYTIYNHLVYSTLEKVWIDEYMDKNDRSDK